MLTSASQSEVHQAAKRRLDTSYHDEQSTSEPPASLQAEMFVDSNHPNQVLQGLTRLRCHSVLYDVILCCEGQEFLCHRYLLASFSPYFQAMFVESTQEQLTMVGVEAQIVGLLVNYAYTSTVSISTANVQALLAASNLFEVAAVREACCDYMERHMDISNCVWIHCIAEAHSCKMLQRHSMAYIVEHFSVVYQQEHSTSEPPASLQAEMFVDSNHPNQVLQGLARLRRHSVLYDVILCCEGQEFLCHRYLLASFSPYFQAMFTSGMVESTQEQVTMVGVEPQIVGLLVNYAYTSTVSISTANVQALLAASNLFEVAAVREACCDYMERHMDISNCVAIYCIAEAHSCKMLQRHSMAYIVEHFSVVYQQEEFLSLSVERLTEILASDHLNVPNDDMVFEAAMLWLDKCPTRKQSFDKVLEQIRLPLISPYYLHTVVQSLDVLTEYQRCQRFISEAKQRFLLPFINTARPRITTVIVGVGVETPDGFPLVESFDPLTSQWMTLGRLPVTLNDYAVVSSGSTMYLAGGYDPTSETLDSHSRDMWRYDVHHNSWSKMAPMNMERSLFSLVMLDAYVYAVGGMETDKSADSMERYDPATNTWQLMESVGVREHYDAVVNHTMVALDGHLYFIAGAPSSHQPCPSQPAKFNPDTSEWTEISPMQLQRDQSAACTLNGKIYVIGGLHEDVREKTVECYTPGTDQWTMCAPLTLGRSSHWAVVAQDSIYILGGSDDIHVEDLGVPDDSDILGEFNLDFNDLSMYDVGFDTIYHSIRGRSCQFIERYCDMTDTWETVGEIATGGCSLCSSLRLRSGHVSAVEDGSL